MRTCTEWTIALVPEGVERAPVPQHAINLVYVILRNGVAMVPWHSRPATYIQTKDNVYCFSDLHLHFARGASLRRERKGVGDWRACDHLRAHACLRAHVRPCASD